MSSSKSLSSRAARSARKAASIAALAGIWALGGCATTVTTVSDDVSFERRERAALAEAAATLSNADWVSAPQPRMFARLAGIEGESQGSPSADAVARRYAAALSDAPRPVDVLVADADRLADAAASFADLAEASFADGAASMGDVAVMETAIQRVRFARSVFLSSVDIVAADDAERRIASLAVRGRFDAAALRLSSLADTVADAAFEARLSAAGLSPLDPVTAGVASVDDGPGR